MHGEGGSVRSYLYVTDVAQAYILVLHKGVIGDTYNIGTQKARAVLDWRFGHPNLVACIPVLSPGLATASA